jgi:hypothetical protein
MKLLIFNVLELGEDRIREIEFNDGIWNTYFYYSINNFTEALKESKNEYKKAIADQNIFRILITMR